MGKAIGERVRRGDIVDAVCALEEAVKQWQETPADSPVLFRGGESKPLTAAVEEAAVNLFKVCDAVDIDRDAWELVLAIDEFDDEMNEFAERYAVAPHDTDPGGTVTMWRAYDRVLEARQERVRKLPEPIAQLLAEKVSRFQIAKIYGWYLPDGRPDVNKLEEEIEKPGRHYNPKNWVSPSERKHREELTARWQVRCQQFAAKAEEEARAAAQQKREAPESVEELLALPNMTVSQVAKMKKMSEDEVRHHAAAAGIAIDGETVALARHFDRRRRGDRERQDSLNAAMAAAMDSAGGGGSDNPEGDSANSN